MRGIIKGVYRRFGGRDIPRRVINWVGLLLLLVGCGEDSAPPTVFEQGFVIEERADIEALEKSGGEAYVIHGDLQIVGSKLVSLAGLEGLRRVEGSVEIWFNDALENLQGLEGLESVGAGLGTAVAPPAGPAVGKPVHVVEGLLIFENKALRSLAGLESLAFVGGGISLVNNEALVALADMRQLVAIEGSLDIWFNGALESLEGLHRLVRVRDFLEVSGNEAVENLDGFRGVDYVGADLIVSNNGRLPEGQVRALAERLLAGGFDGAVVIEGNAPE